MAHPDIVVLPPGDHGHPSTEYTRELRDRLPNTEIRHADSAAQAREYLADAPIATGSTLSPEQLEQASELKLFACTWAGYGHLPLDALADNDVTVTNASGVFAPNIAEYVIGKLLEFVRRSRHGWEQETAREWRHYMAGELAGSTVTIVGLGSIGMATATRLEAFDVTTIGVRHTPSKDGPVDEVIGYKGDPIHEALSRTDFLVLACPLTDTTRGLIGSAEFDRLPPSSVIVNIARGPVINTDALVDAIQDQSIGGAALDVTDPEPLPPDHVLWRFDNVHITPHNAGATPKLPARLADLLADNVEHAKETGEYTGLRNQIIP